MAHVEAQSSASQSEKFYGDINHAYILVGRSIQTYKIVICFSREGAQETQMFSKGICVFVLL
jgi:hypothetical protein